MAVKWLSKAAKQGHVDAQHELGDCYRSGIGVKGQNYVAAAKWYREAAQQGHAAAQMSLAGLYSTGEGVGGKNLPVMAELIHEVATRGDKAAQVRMARCFEEGTGVPQNAKTAAQWRSKAGVPSFTSSSACYGFFANNAKAVATTVAATVVAGILAYSYS
ncbi:hypothetical protein BH10PSE19_BH10PSE19_18570 [soil metagenome]